MNYPNLLITKSVEETEDVGNMLARTIAETNSNIDFIAMYGDLGVGKTAFIRGFCKELCPHSVVKSPTFALVNEYRCKSGTRFSRIYHFDMYRIDSEDDLYSIGFYDYTESGNLCIVEWSEKIPFALPDCYLKVVIEKTDNGNGRRIIISKEFYGGTDENIIS